MNIEAMDRAELLALHGAAARALVVMAAAERRGVRLVCELYLPPDPGSAWTFALHPAPLEAIEDAPPAVETAETPAAAHTQPQGIPEGRGDASPVVAPPSGSLEAALAALPRECGGETWTADADLILWRGAIRDPDMTQRGTLSRGTEATLQMALGFGKPAIRARLAQLAEVARQFGPRDIEPALLAIRDRKRAA